jgi:hypothetical protein
MSFSIFNLLNFDQLGRESSMHAKDLILNNSSNWHVVKTVRKSLPKSDRMSSFALFVKSVDSIDAVRFVISSQNEEVIGILDLIG